MEKKDIQFTERFRRGYEHLETFDSPNMWRINGQYEENPDAARFTAEYVFGDIYLRDQIDMKTRKVIIIGALMAKGTCPNPLYAQMEAYLENGGTINDLREMLVLCQALGGVPNSGNSTGRLRELIVNMKKEGKEVPAPLGLCESDLGGMSRQEWGHDYLKRNGGQCGKDLVDAIRPQFPDLFRYYEEFILGDIVSRGRLDEKLFHNFVLAFMATQDADVTLLKFHIQCALNNGFTKDDINEIAIVLSGYMGFGTAMKLAKAAAEVIGG